MRAPNESPSLISAQFGHAITVIVIYWVVKLLGLHVWTFLGQAGAVVLGIAVIFSVMSNLAMVGVIFGSDSKLKSEGLSTSVFILPMIFKLAVDFLAALLVFKLFVLFL